MTDQVPTEYVRFKEEAYILLKSEQVLFSLWDHDIHPEDIDSSNWAGFVAHFDIHDRQLYLDYLTVGHTPPARKRVRSSHFKELLPQEASLDELIGDYYLPALNNVEATDAGMGYWHYQNINLALDYNGTLTLTTMKATADFNEQEPYYLELAFEQGRLISATTLTHDP